MATRRYRRILTPLGGSFFVYGVRGVGKSTWARQTYPQYGLTYPIAIDNEFATCEPWATTPAAGTLPALKVERWVNSAPLTAAGLAGSPGSGLWTRGIHR